MKNSLDHLNLQKQREVAYIRKVILEELEARLCKSTSKRVARYRILKLVLYGSFARGTWFDDRKSGRASDYDFLVIVSHKALTDMTTFWSSVEDRLFQDPKIQKDISIIVHTLRDVNKSLGEGQYFFTEVINQGVLLYDSDAKTDPDKPKSRLAQAGSPNPQKAYEIAANYASLWRKKAKLFLGDGIRHAGRGVDENNHAAFHLHQAAEAIYRMVLLTVTLYAPATHHLGKLRQRCEAIDPRLAEAWGPERKPFKRYFELLRRAYVEARYSPAYETNAEILKWQAERIARLLELAEASCQERLAKLETEAKTFKSTSARNQ
ncbi:HEPN domain-containing protein [bacterium]|nr:HEPN domain-containing protein [bacterium]